MKSTNVYHDEFPESTTTNPDFALMVARYACYAFPRVSPRLRNDKSFVIRAIQANPYTYLKISVSFMTDHEIVLATFTHNSVGDVLEGLLEDEPISFKGARKDVLLRLKSDAVEKIYVWEGVVKGLLLGFSSSVGKGSANSCVSMIDADPETSFFLRKTIADFVGVPSPSQVAQLKRFVKNLNKYDRTREWL